MKEDKEDIYINLALENLKCTKALQQTMEELITSNDNLRESVMKLLIAVFEG